MTVCGSRKFRNLTYANTKTLRNSLSNTLAITNHGLASIVIKKSILRIKVVY